MQGEVSSDCPICGGSMAPRFSVPCDAKKPGIPKAYRVHWCNTCDYGHVVERPRPEEIAGFYDLEDYYTHHLAGDSASRRERSMLDRLRVHLAWRLDKGQELSPLAIVRRLAGSRKRLCEIGCGNGKKMRAFLECGFVVTGVEPDSEAREMARHVSPQVFDGAAESLPAEVLGQEFDVVLMSHVLEHCSDVNLAVQNARRILADTGILVVETPNCSCNGFSAHSACWPWTDIPRHLNFFTPGSLAALLEKHSLQVSTTEYTGFCRQFSSVWIGAERNNWRAFAAWWSDAGHEPDFVAHAWGLLLKALHSSRASKYDSVRHTVGKI